MQVYEILKGELIELFYKQIKLHKTSQTADFSAGRIV